MKSAAVNLKNDEGIFCRSFPYYHIVDDEQLYWSKINESALFIQDLILNQTVSDAFPSVHDVSHYCSSSFNDIMLIFRILEESFGLISSRSSFLCCSGHSGIECLLASCHEYKDNVSIEMTETSAITGKSLISVLFSGKKATNEEHQTNERKIQLITGSFLDYFSSQANVILIDSTSFCYFPSASVSASSCCSNSPFSMIDEGYLVALFLKVCINLVSGSYVIIFTSQMLSLNEQALEEMGFSSYLKCVYQKIDDGVRSGYRKLDSTQMREKGNWILKKQ
jgi:hypothetical protein